MFVFSVRASPGPWEPVEAMSPEELAVLPHLHQTDGLQVPAGLAVLIGEPCPIYRELLVHMLGMLGLEATVAANAEQMRESLLQGIFDLVFVDEEWVANASSQRSGERRGRVKREPREPPYVVALCSRYDAAAVADGQAPDTADIDEYIQKPISLERLKRLISNNLK